MREASPNMGGTTRPEIPDHEILRLIGKGAYGEVWLARSLTGTYRAVKVVWRHDYKDEATYVREFESIQQYEPVARGIPGVVHILHVGQKHSEYYYYVMELADDAYTGIHIDPESYVPRTLHSDMELYGNNPMPLDYVLEVGSQLAHALDGMHCEKLSHRDVKPSNIVFVNGRAKLADAGSVAQSNNLSFAGTEGYLPPDGAGTPRADVYALAKVLYEMSTGKDRLDFPELPDKVPEGSTHRRWLEFNEIICAAAEPRADKSTIITAAELADRLDALRQYAPHHKLISLRRRRWITIAMLTTLVLSLGVFIAFLMLPRQTRERLISATRGNHHAKVEKKTPRDDTGQLFISSVPAGASIYTPDGTYVDETPYGPVEEKPGTEVAFTLRKEGYADCEVSGQIPRGGVLALGSELQPYRPPQRGEEWMDALGTIYYPDAGEHKASAPVTVQQFESYLRRVRPKVNIPYDKTADGQYVRTTQEGIGAYILWLLHMCEIRGFLGGDHTLVAEAEPGTGDGGQLCAYRLVTRPVQKVPITVRTSPPGAMVWLNGKSLGVTPLQGVRVPLAPYFIEIKMAGFATERFSGMSPRDVSLDVTMKLNNSVSFGKEWTNSLGLNFKPLLPNLLAGTTEVRVADFHAFAATTGAPIPPPTDFVQSPQHPVVGVTRAMAERFARWLTAQEREAGLIEATDEYRLPTDEEWSAMAGLKDEKGASPYERGQVGGKGPRPDFYWGLEWPPPPGSGNFSDVSARAYVAPQHVLEYYTDNFPFTAPVGSFAANKLGFHDMEGNVQEWVSDEYGGPTGFAFRHYGVTRGGDFGSFRPAQLSTGSRTPRPVDAAAPTVGFRLMLERAARSN